MAYTTRYFSTTAAGAGDGTSWADRAAFLDGSNEVTTIITGFDFSTDNLLCYLGPGTYEMATVLINTDFTVSPPVANAGLYGKMFLWGCDSSGNQLEPNDPGWTASEGDYDTTGYPVISAVAGESVFSTIWCWLRCVKVLGSSNGMIGSFSGGATYCYLENTGSFTTAFTYTPTATSWTVNVHLKASGTSFATVAGTGAGLFSNARIEGNSSASAGAMHGISNTASVVIVPFNGPCVVVNCPGTGVINTSSNAGGGVFAVGVTIDNCNTGLGTGGITAGSGLVIPINSYIANCTEGLKRTPGRIQVVNSRLRNTTNYNTTPTFSTSTAYVAAGSDADEYVDKAGGDYRIKNTSDYWDRNIGAHDQPVTGGGGGGTSINMRGGFVN